MATTTGTPTLNREPQAAVAEAQPATTADPLDTLADATPASRDRVVDLFRAVSIGVVVLWHWTFSIIHWGNGSLRMPNPIGDVPGLWAATWVLQVMPLFFLVGGYSNLAGWRSVVRSGGGNPARRFWGRRFSRLVRPVAVYVTLWAVVDLAWQAGGGRSVLSWGMVVFVPLWFLGVYVAVVALVPWTARLHGRRPVHTVLGLGAGILAADLVRFSFGFEAAGLVTTALVWVFCHQLGYLWHDWSQGDPAGAAGIARRGRSLALAGVAGLLVLTTAGPYPRSMVAVRGEELSNMFPTTACVALLAVLQLGLVLWLRAPLSRWLAHRSVWKGVIAANSMAMTVFCWHMTALVGFLLAYEAAGFTLATQPTAGWWLTRPVWVVGPGLLLAGLLAIFARFERPALRHGETKPKQSVQRQSQSLIDSKAGTCAERHRLVPSRRSRPAGRGHRAGDLKGREGPSPASAAGRAAAGGAVRDDDTEDTLGVQRHYFFPPFGV